MKARLSAAGSVLAVIALGIALWSAQRLKKTEAAIRRVVEPVPLTVPDLFPADTMLYAEARGWEGAWDQVESAIAAVQDSAAWLVLKRKWEEDRGSIPSDLRAPLEEVVRQLQAAEARFGYRPTTREFIETYGRHAAFALVPAGEGARPAALLIVRLPDGGATGMLQSKLGAVAGVAPCEPPLRRGFPMFREDVRGIGSVVYGVARGHLVVSDHLHPVEQVLDRIAEAADPENPRLPAGSLGADDVLKRVAAPAGHGAALLLYVRRDQNFAGYDPSLACVDGALKNAFALAPGDPAVAFAASGRDARSPLAGRVSFTTPVPGPWERALPGGAFQVELPGTATAAEVAAAGRPALRRFFDQPLWRELDALLSDPERVRRLGREAFSGGPLLEDEAIRRLPNDARFVARSLRTLIERASEAKAPAVAGVGKGYALKDGVVMAEYAVGFDADELPAFLLSGALDELAKRFPDWVKADSRGGARVWRLPIEKAAEFARSDATEEWGTFVEAYMDAVEPAVVMAGRRVYAVLGRQLREEVASIAGGAGGAVLAEDPLYAEAMKAVPPVRTRLSIVRPGERLEAMVSVYRALVPRIEREFPGDQEVNRDVFHAAVRTADAVLGWTRAVRATIEWEVPDPERPGGSLALLDPAFDKTPSAGLPDGLLLAPGVLPEETWFLQDWRLSVSPVYDAVRQKFVEALPGGEKRLRQLGDGTEEDRRLSDALVDGIFRNIRGETGVAIACSELDADEIAAQGVQAQISRAPAVVLFATFADPELAWTSIRTGLDRLQKEVNPIPYEEMFEKYRRRGGEPPWKAAVSEGRIGRCPAMALDLHVPVVSEGRYVLASFLVVRRDALFFFTNSIWAARRIAFTRTDAPGTLGARLARIPNQAVPSIAAELRLYRQGGYVDQSRRDIETVLEPATAASLRGYAGKPPEDRLRAHRWGWTKGYNLVLDLFEDPGWEITVTRRTAGKAQVERKHLQEAGR